MQAEFLEVCEAWQSCQIEQENWNVLTMTDSFGWDLRHWLPTQLKKSKASRVVVGFATSVGGNQPTTCGTPWLDFLLWTQARKLPPESPETDGTQVNCVVLISLFTAHS